MREVIEEVRKVYKLKSQGKTVIWPLVNYEFEEEHAAMDIRSGYVKGEQLHGLKMLNNFPENREKGLAPFNGIMMVYDSNTGFPSASWMHLILPACEPVRQVPSVWTV